MKWDSQIPGNFSNMISIYNDKNCRVFSVSAAPKEWGNCLNIRHDFIRDDDKYKNWGLDFVYNSSWNPLGLPYSTWMSFKVRLEKVNENTGVFSCSMNGTPNFVHSTWGPNPWDWAGPNYDKWFLDGKKTFSLDELKPYSSDSCTVMVSGDKSNYKGISEYPPTPGAQIRNFYYMPL